MDPGLLRLMYELAGEWEILTPKRAIVVAYKEGKTLEVSIRRRSLDVPVQGNT